MPDGQFTERISMANPALNPHVSRLPASGNWAGAVRLEPVDRLVPLPLSFSQQRLWFLDQFAPGNNYYNMSTGWRMNGAVDIAALRSALRSVIARHEVLRSLFTLDDGIPVQSVGPAWLPSLEPVDVGGPDAEQRAAELTTEEINRPFDLRSGQLLRARLLRLDDDDHVLVVVIHHIACDVWSLDILDRELWACYRAHAAGTEAELPELPLQYGDYASWQRSWLSAREIEQRLGWWRRYLEGAPLVLDLPTDSARPSTASFRGASQWFSVSPQAAAGFRKLAERTSTTLFMVLFAAFQSVIARWSGQDDLIIGVPVAGRSQPQLEKLIGFFVNTLPVRTSLRGDPSFEDLLLRVRESVLGALTHQEVPFEAIVEDLAPDRDLSRNPVVQVVFQLMSTPGSKDRWNNADPSGTLTSEGWFGRERSSSHFDLSVRMFEPGEDEIGGEIVYATDLFTRDTIERLATWLTNVLEHVARDSSSLLSDLPLTSQDEWRPLSTAQGQASRPVRTLAEVLAAQARETPAKPALRWADGELSYGELDRLADRVAQRLRAMGVGPESVVGLCCGPGAPVAVGLWGILKAGAAYMVLDPGYPDQRLAYMIGETKSPAVVTEPEFADRVDAFGVRAVALDSAGSIADEATAQAAQAATTPDPALTADGSNLAYVAFTSGSTGEPKGVMVTHDHMVNYVSWCLDELPIGRADLVPLASSIAFAGSVLPLFGAWASGRCVVLGARDDPFSWCQSVRDAAFVKITPSALRFLSGRFGRCWDGWECVVLASEPIRRRDLELVSGAAAPAVVSHYGATETNGSAVWWSPAGERGEEGVLGRPAADARLMVVDRWGAPVGIGVTGELCVAGRSVARGYWRRPALTAERFVPDPEGPPGTRMFRTGDLARWRADGNLEFIGRLDEQLKVRGFRVEPGEIEAVLEAHPAVRTAAVAGRPDASGAERLVAWLIPAADQRLDRDEIRAWLRARLPEYMVPSAILLADELPLSSTGKLDRARLVVTDESGGDRDVNGERQLSPVEKTLIAIWGEVLGRHGIEPDDNFFVLGGHSLLAIKLVSLVQDAFGVDYPLTALFGSPTVAAMAAAIDESTAGGSSGQPA
jgi:amino acid adenylation domain-containing protein